MENRPAPLRSRRVCRFCLTESEPLNFIYERDHSKPFQVPLTLQIMSCVSIEVYAADGMPQMICTMCRWNLDRSYKFKIQCKKADEALRSYPVTGVLPRPFPPISTDPPDIGNKRSAEKRSHDQVKKQKMDAADRDRRDLRDRDRDRQAQVADNQREKPDSHDLYEDEQDGGSDGEQDASNEKEIRKLEPGEIRVHACDQCDRTFPLRQALQLHVQRAHRDRNYKCTECDKMFFSKYDLAKHSTTHSEEKPFSCPICHKQFSRANLLQRHEKIHRDELRYGCQHCDREFFTTEELEKHEESVHKAVKPFQCNICNKRFTYKQGLERHELLHSEDKSFLCEYCKEAFRTSTKLARHLTTHAGHRPYLCKMCPRSFLLSHHLTRHMRTHSVERPHVCEECGKAFKRKESLEVHQLTHAKRGMGLTCDICQESCRNRADYVTHIKQHIEAGEKMGPDGLKPEARKEKIESESEEDDEEEQYSDGDDNDYEPPAYMVKKIPKSEPPESEEEMDNKADRKEHVVYLRSKDGNMVKKTIKTLMPIQKREIHDSKVKPSPSGAQSSKTPQTKSEKTKSSEESPPKLRSQNRVDETEAQVQKIVASVFKEHKIPLKHHTQDEPKDSPNAPAQPKAQPTPQTTPIVATSQPSKEDFQKSETPSMSNTPKSVNTVKVIKRIVVRKPTGGAETTPSVVSSVKEAEASPGNTPQGTPGTGPKVTKRVIVRRIIRQGDTTREVIMNPDGTLIDPAELAKLPTGNVVKRVVVKKPMDKAQMQSMLQQTTGEQRQAMTLKTSGVDSKLIDSPKFELKTSQTSAGTPQTTKKPPAPQKPTEITKTELKSSEASTDLIPTKKGDQDSTKEKLEQLEKRVEQQRLKIEELQAKKQHEYESVEEMLPERHDESEDEQQLPLKRVFVKRKQSIYDEEQEYDSDEKKEKVASTPIKPQSQGSKDELQKKEYRKPTVTSTSKVYGNKKVILVKAEELSQVDDAAINRELSNILDSTEDVVKMQESVLSNLNQISALDENSQRIDSENLEGDNSLTVEPMDQDPDPDSNESREVEIRSETVENESQDGSSEIREINEKTEDTIAQQDEESQEVEATENEESTTANDDSQPDSSMLHAESIFTASDSDAGNPKPDITDLEDSVIELRDGNETINLNDTNESQDSIEDKLSQLEG